MARRTIVEVIKNVTSGRNVISNTCVHKNSDREKRPFFLDRVAPRAARRSFMDERE